MRAACHGPRFPRNGRDAFTTSFGLGRPPHRAVPAKLARNNRSAAPPCRKTSGSAFTPRSVCFVSDADSVRRAQLHDHLPVSNAVRKPAEDLCCSLGSDPDGFMTLAQLMERGEIQTGVSAKSWDDAVWIAARPLLDDGRMTERYIQQVFDMAKRYGQHGVILAPLCAPHAEPDISNKASISVVTTSDDVVVSMGGDEVRLNVIMLLCLQTPVAHAVALDELFSLVDEYPGFMGDLHDAHTPAEAPGVTKRYLKHMLRQLPTGSMTDI